jgi:hypothetical protein
MNLAQRDHDLLRFSLVFVWLATAIVSVWELHDQSTQVLSATGIQNPSLMHLLILGGAAVDALLGLAMWCMPGRRTYLAALAFMLSTTLIATMLQPSLWLHPLGPLTKNIPIAAVLWILAKASR